MKKLTLLALLALAPVTMLGTVVTYNMSGEVTTATGFPGISIGMPFSGSFTYDTSTPFTGMSLENDALHVVTPSGVNSIEVTIDSSSTFTSDPGNEFRIAVGDNDDFDLDRFILRGAISGVSALSFFSVILQDPTMTAFSGTTIPETLNLLDFPGAKLVRLTVPASQIIDLQLHSISLASVPDHASSGPILFFSLIALAAARRAIT